MGQLRFLYMILFLTVAVLFIESCGKKEDVPVVVKPEIKAEVPEEPGIKSNYFEIYEKQENEKKLDVYLDQELKGHENYIFSVEFSPDSKYLASGSADKSIRIWNFETWELEKEIPLSYENLWGMPVKYSPDGKYLLIGVYEDLGIVDVQNDYKLVSREFAHARGVQSLEVTPDSKYGITAGVDGKIIVWNLETKEVENEVIAHKKQVWSISISPDGKKLVTGGEDGMIKIWNFPDLTLDHSIDFHGKPIEYVDYSSDGSMFLTASMDSTITIWKIGQYEYPYRILEGIVGAVLVSKFSPDGKYVFSGGLDRDVYIHKVETGEVKYQLTGHKSHVMGLDISQDGQWLSTCSRDKMVYLWNMNRY